MKIFYKVLLVVVVAVAVLFLSGILSAQGHNGNDFEHVRKVQEKHTGRLMAIKGVVGTAVGLDPDDQPTVRVFVEDAADARIPKKLDEVPVEVVVTGKIYALKPGDKPATSRVNPAARFPRPVPIGVSTGHPNITAGTISCRVKDASGNVYALSNNHIYANENLASTGDNVLQPGPYDGGKNPQDAIGTLSVFVPIVFYNTANPPKPIPTNTIDAAIALSSTANLGNATPSNGYGKPKSTTASASVGMQVQKYGRTTALTQGRIYATNATVDVTYDHGVARFVGQIIITPGNFSAGGDSGSLIVKKDRNAGENNKPVGLLFAGSRTITVANPINEVLSAFGVSVDGE
jgi:hypothetical protein